MGSYIEEVQEALHLRVDDYDQWGENPSRLLDLYALLVVTKGEQTTLEDIHDAWALHTSRINPEHRYLVPFNELPEDVAEYDRPYLEAVHEVALERRATAAKAKESGGGSTRGSRVSASGSRDSGRRSR